MPELWGRTLTRIDLLKRVGDMRQMADVWPFELSEGNERGTRGVADAKCRRVIFSSPARPRDGTV